MDIGFVKVCFTVCILYTCFARFERFLFEGLVWFWVVRRELSAGGVRRGGDGRVLIRLLQGEREGSLGVLGRESGDEGGVGGCQ
jgi:hypothetical protein